MGHPGCYIYAVAEERAMKCFSHQQDDAVGSCKHCFKGVCGQCAKDTDMGIVCSPSCEAEVKTIHSMIERNKKMYAFAPKTHSRNAIWLSMLGVLLIAFGTFSEFRFVSAYLIGSGVVMFCGAGFSLFNSRRMAKLAALDKN
jgi:hypothetical protein